MRDYAVNMVDKMREWQDVANILHYVLKMAVLWSGSLAISVLVSFTAYKTVRLYMDSADLADSAIRGTLPEKNLKRRMQLLYKAQRIIDEAENKRYPSSDELQRSITAVGRVVNEIREEI